MQILKVSDYGPSKNKNTRVDAIHGSIEKNNGRRIYSPKHLSESVMTSATEKYVYPIRGLLIVDIINVKLVHLRIEKFILH